MRRTAKSKKIPYVPPNTCPYIDRVIELLNDMTELNNDNEDWMNTLAMLIKAHMEYIRSANEKLRESGRYWHEEYKNK